MEKIIYRIVNNKLTHIIVLLLLLYLTSKSIYSLLIYDFDKAIKAQLILKISSSLIYMTSFIFLTTFYAKLSYKQFIKKIKNL
ncbi:MAG: hypothetical protein ACI83B_004066 [Sediminicola sp.]|jgi:hypothetical protein